MEYYSTRPLLTICLSAAGLRVVFTRCAPIQLITAITLSHMSLWAWLTYSSTYAWIALKAPFSLTLWQHFYNLNVLFVVQETADTFGLVCLGVLFLSAQLLSRNFMFSVYTLAPSASTLGDAAKSPSSYNTPKRLSILTTSLQHLQTLLRSTSSELQDGIRNRRKL